MCVCERERERAARKERTYHNPLAGEVSDGLVRGSGHFDGFVGFVGFGGER